jgi:hypothetical protein
MTNPAALRFLANGTLVSLRLGEREIAREISAHRGFFALRFDGARLHETILPHVTLQHDGGLQVTGANGFPRLQFKVAAGDSALRMTLVRVEGMPDERDVSLGFRLGLALPCTATASGSGVVVKPGARELQVYWVTAGSRPPQTDFGGFVLTPTAPP